MRNAQYDGCGEDAGGIEWRYMSWVSWIELSHCCDMKGKLFWSDRAGWCHCIVPQSLSPTTGQLQVSITCTYNMHFRKDQLHISSQLDSHFRSFQKFHGSEVASLETSQLRANFGKRENVPKARCFCRFPKSAKTTGGGLGQVRLRMFGMGFAGWVPRCPVNWLHFVSQFFFWTWYTPEIFI